MDSITVPVANQPLPGNASASIDARPLQRTGTWAWMAAELSHIEPGKPAAHEAHRDLESFFYILLGICLLYDNPGRFKPAKDLAEYFDPFFAVTQPSTLKTVTIQSNLGWTAFMTPYLSPYLQPLIPLLEKVRKELILPIKWHKDRIQANRDFTQDDFINSIVTTLSELPDSCWVSKEQINPSSAGAVPRGGSASSCVSLPPAVLLPPTATSPSFGTSRMSGDALQQDPPIRVPGTSSIAGSLKRRSENEPGSDSRPAKRRSPFGGA